MQSLAARKRITNAVITSTFHRKENYGLWYMNHWACRHVGKGLNLTPCGKAPLGLWVEFWAVRPGSLLGSLLPVSHLCKGPVALSRCRAGNKHGNTWL